jgi:hypothetical protein
MDAPLRRSAAWLATVVAVAVASGAQALSLAVVTDDRQGSAEASASANGTTDFETDTTGPLLVATASVPFDASAAASGGQSASTVPEPGTAKLMQGDGSIRASATTKTADAFALGTGEQSLRIEFRPSEDAVVSLNGSLRSFAYGAGDALALIELSSLDAVVDPVLAAFEVGPGDPALLFEELVELHAGELYRLLVVTRANADALGGAVGHQDASAFRAAVTWRLSEVPEPGTALLLAGGIAAFAARRPGRTAAPRA